MTAPASGPAYSTAMKAVATLIFAGATGGLLNLLRHPSVDSPRFLTELMLAGLFVLAVGWWSIVAGRTSIDATSIRQTGLWNKEVALAGIHGCQLVHWPRLAWLVAPRLIVRSGGFGVTTFYTSDAEVLRAFASLAAPRALGR